MEPIKAPRTLKVYSLVKQTGLSLNYVGFSTNAPSIGTGFFITQIEAEYHRTLELLKDISMLGMPKSQYHVFELEIPNPAYQE